MRIVNDEQSGLSDSEAIYRLDNRMSQGIVVNDEDRQCMCASVNEKKNKAKIFHLNFR
jgi:hypothetical protein